MGKMILAVALVLMLPAAARAEDGTAAAKRHFSSGRKHFDLGEYQQALDDFKEGYRLKDDPVFLYNIAQCYRLLNEHEEAIRAYRSYLNRAPDAPNRDEVERKIAALQEAIASEHKAQTTPPNHVMVPAASPPAETTPAAAGAPAAALTAQATPPRAPTPLYKKWWLWTAVGGAVAVGLGVGLGVGLSQHGSGNTFPAVQY